MRTKKLWRFCSSVLIVALSVNMCLFNASASNTEGNDYLLSTPSNAQEHDEIEDDEMEIVNDIIATPSDIVNQEKVVQYDPKPKSLKEVQELIDAYNASLAEEPIKPHWEFLVEEELMPEGYYCALVEEDEEFGADYYTFFPVVAIRTLTLNGWDGLIATSFAGGTGTADEPYLIAAASQLAYLAQSVNTNTTYSGKYFELTCDIDLDYIEWTPIGNSSRSFKGNFDGSNYEIRGMYINSQSNYQGLFGKAESSCIKNVKIIDISITGGNYVGGIVGYTTSSIDNCTISGSVIGNNYVGGIAGQGSSFTNCTNKGEEVTGSANKIGGIAGYKTGALACTGLYNSAKITGITDVGGIFGDRVASELTDSENIGEVTGAGNCVGGIVGINGGGLMRNCVNAGEIINTGLYTGGIFGNKSTTTDLIVDHCMNKGNVTGSDYTGGIIGRKTNRNIEITSCENTGNIKGVDYVGGIGGSITEHITVIEDCINTGLITGVNYLGGIVGHTNKEIKNCNNANSISGYDYVGGIAGYSTASIVNCMNTVSATGNSYIGGIAGYVSGRIEESFNTGEVTGSGDRTSGIAGYVHKGPVFNCYNTGAVTGGGDTGGIAGYYQANSSGSRYIENCYNSGSITGRGNTGSLIGRYGYAITIKNSYYLNGSAGAGVGYGDLAVTGTEVTPYELKALASVLGDTYADDTNNVNQGYPILSAFEYNGHIEEEYPETFRITVTDEFSYNDGLSRSNKRFFLATTFKFSYDKKNKQIIVKTDLACLNSIVNKPDVDLRIEIEEGTTKDGPFTPIAAVDFPDAGYLLDHKISIPSKTAHYRITGIITNKSTAFNHEKMSDSTVMCVNRTAHEWKFDYTDEISGKEVTAPPTDLFKWALYDRDDVNYRQNYIRDYEAFYGVKLVLDNFWDPYEVHHIQPLSHGGDHSFGNLIHLPKDFHKQITNWWNGY